MRLLAKVDPNNPLLAGAAQWLMLARNGGEWWDSTEQTAMVLFGLVDYLAASHELESDFTADVLVNGHSAGQRHFTPADALSGASLAIDIDAAHLQPGSNSVQIVRRSGSGRIYWSARGRLLLDGEKGLPGGNDVAEPDPRLLQAAADAEERQDRLHAAASQRHRAGGRCARRARGHQRLAHALPSARRPHPRRHGVRAKRGQLSARSAPRRLVRLVHAPRIPRRSRRLLRRRLHRPPGDLLPHPRGQSRAHSRSARRACSRCISQASRPPATHLQLQVPAPAAQGGAQ